MLELDHAQANRASANRRRDFAGADSRRHGGVSDHDKGIGRFKDGGIGHIINPDIAGPHITVAFTANTSSIYGI